MLDVLFKEWARNNPEQASAITNTIGIIETALTEAAQQLLPIIEVLCPELTADRLKKRYEETGVAIQIDEAARLALLMLAHRIPYTGPDPKPIPRWDVHFREIDDDRKDSTAPHITFRPQLGGQP